MPNSPESLPARSPERTPTAPTVEQFEKDLARPETAGELTVENSEKEVKKEKARAAVEKAISVEAGGKEKDVAPATSSPRQRSRISTKEKEASFKKRIEQTQKHLSPTSRTFSKVIHAKPIEKASDAIGSTVARPNAILAGAVTAFFLVLAVYLTAKTLGYVLSGFETIAAFIVGWVLGITYDYFRVLVTGKR